MSRHLVACIAVFGLLGGVAGCGGREWPVYADWDEFHKALNESVACERPGDWQIDEGDDGDSFWCGRPGIFGELSSAESASSEEEFGAGAVMNAVMTMPSDREPSDEEIRYCASQTHEGGYWGAVGRNWMLWFTDDESYSYEAVETLARDLGGVLLRIDCSWYSPPD